MTSDLILSNLKQHLQLDEAEVEFLLSVLIARPFKQGELLIESGEPARYMVFVNGGYLMTYYTDRNGTDHVIQFSAEGWWSGDVHSFGENARTKYSTKALSDGEALLLPRPALEKLLESHPKFERYFRIIFQKGLMRQRMRYIEGHSTSAEERYQSFIAAYPSLAREVPQKYIASYLGITPEFLSKVRKKLST